MNCDDLRAQLPDYWDENLDPTALMEFEAHLDTCASCREEARSLGVVWNRLSLVPAEELDPSAETSKVLRARFYETLSAYRHGVAEAEQRQRRASLGEWFRRLWPQRPALQFAVSMATLVMGLGVGYLLRSGRTETVPATGDVAQLRGEVNQMRQLVTLSLLQQQSASDRLRGVNWSYRVEQSDTEVLSALLYTVNHDSNVNVRLAAVDALRNFADSEVARKGLVQTLSKQTSPLVQIAVIDTMTELREKQAVPALKALMADTSVSPEVKDRARLASEKLK